MFERAAPSERAKIGVYISLEPHTEPMKKEAAGAGHYDGPAGKVLKIQLFTIEELFAGKDSDHADGARLQSCRPRRTRRPV